MVFGFLLVFWSCFKSARKCGCAFGTSSFDLGDVASYENSAYDSKFVETIGGGDELKDFFY